MGSRQLNGAEQNYLVHEQEMLVTIWALKWRASGEQVESQLTGHTHSHPDQS